MKVFNVYGCDKAGCLVHASYNLRTFYEAWRYAEEFPAIRSLKEILDRMVDYIGGCSYPMSPVQNHEFEVKYE